MQNISVAPAHHGEVEVGFLCLWIDLSSGSEWSCSNRPSNIIKSLRSVVHVALHSFLTPLAFRPCELLPSLFVRPSTFHILIFSSETTGPIATKLWWNCPWMAPFQNCVRWSWLPTKMATKLKIEKSGDEIIPLEMHFFVDSLLLVTQIIKGKQLFTKCEVGKAKFWESLTYIFFYSNFDNLH